MMQIETIIINTSLIQITEKSIPENFLKSSSSPANSTACNELPDSQKMKRNFNESSTSNEDFQPLRSSSNFYKGAKFPYQLNSLDLLKANSKKPLQ